MTRGFISKCMPALALAGAILLSLPPGADALPLQASADIGGVSVLACDNVAAGGACPGGIATLTDVDPAVGSLGTLGFTVGTIEVSFALQTSDKSPGPGGLNTLSSSGTQIENTGAAPVTILLTVSDINYLGPAFTFTTTGSGTWVDPRSSDAAFNGSTITMEWWNDALNTQGADFAGDTPGIMVATFTHTPVGTINNQSFSNDQAGAITDPGLFSMTLHNELVLGPGIRLESRGQAESKPTAVVPAPATLLLLGSALGLLGWRRWKSPA